MNKPLVLVIDDLHDNIIKLMNESQLPPSQLEPIVREIYNQIVAARQQERAEAKKQFEAELAKEQEQTESEVKE